MTDKEVEEIMQKWLAFELYMYILPYLFLYGEAYVNDPLNAWQIRRDFEREWADMREEEKDRRFKLFYTKLKESEKEGVEGDEKNEG